ncbi:hypothetical protein NR402_02100 [Acidithiobacillus ferrooxidans]|uniref:hypothetical protein n=1 Tax=Acidithiobacillus ferrooxidans TaxID=920 RepID=UPI00214AE16A|nr:hypothetical protein [Acidithiobacillus ferrooxidans]MCR2829083.1 hypothetical protein [Acidithiobacillus ferrooxidans]
MISGPYPELYPQVNCQSIPVGYLPEGKNKPIISNMNQQEIRRRNLAKVRDADFGGHQGRMADVAGCAATTLSRILHGKKVEDVIREWEKNLGYQVGALDRLDFEPTDAFRTGSVTPATPEARVVPSLPDRVADLMRALPENISPQVQALIQQILSKSKDGKLSEGSIALLISTVTQLSSDKP